MIATASLKMPSPKISENKRGSDSYFTKDIAAIISEEHRRAPTTTQSIAVSVNGSHSPVTGSYYLIKLALISK